MDPRNPGAVDEIIHLGDFWDEKGMRKNRDMIIRENMEVGRTFARAYRYLKAAAAIYEDTAAINKLAMDYTKANAITKRILDDLFIDTGISVKEGKQRRLFASAITPDGLKNYLQSIFTTGKAYVENFFMRTCWNKSPIGSGYSAFLNAFGHIFCMFGIFCLS